MNPNITHKYWMNITRGVADASTCRVKVGCVIINNNFIVGMGYVGSVSGDHHCDVRCNLVDAPHKGSSSTGQSCIRTIHAEANAVIKCRDRGSSDSGWLVCYCTHHPCLDCLKLLLQIGVRNIYYIHDYKDKWRDQYISNLHPGFNTLKDGLVIRKLTEREV